MTRVLDITHQIRRDRVLFAKKKILQTERNVADNVVGVIYLAHFQ